MATLLHLEASPRHDRSYSSRLAAAFLDAYRNRNPDDGIDHLHLFDHALPDFDAEAAQRKMAQIARLMREGKGIEPVGKWGEVVAQIERLKAADKVLLSSPMWNYSVPYRLKQYIDIVAQPGLTFYVTREGEYKGLVTGRPMQMILSSGSAYANGPAGNGGNAKIDFQRPYLQHIAGFLGFSDVRILKMEPTAAGAPDAIQKIFEAKLAEARQAGEAF